MFSAIVNPFSNLDKLLKRACFITILWTLAIQELTYGAHVAFNCFFLTAANTGIARALDYSLKRWVALTRYLDDGQLPIDNNRIENQIRPIALGRKNWLFAGSLRAGQRAAAVMSLIQSAKLNGHDPYAYLKDVLMRLPTQQNSDIEELLPHQWQPVQHTN